MSGSKHDKDKAPITMIPSEAIEEMAHAFNYGAKKYTRNNFKSGIEYTRLLDAAFRHMLAFNNNEDTDPESSRSHISHALASLAMLMYMIKNKPEMDDRYKK